VALGSGSRDAKANPTTPSTPSVRQNSHASSKSRTLDSSDVPLRPTQEQTLVTMSRIAREVLNASITAPLTQVGSPHNDRPVTLDDIESITEPSSQCLRTSFRVNRFNKCEDKYLNSNDALYCAQLLRPNIIADDTG